MAATQKKIERLEARVTHKQKKLLVRAAQIKGQSLTEFIVTSAQETASRTVHEQEVLTLRERDREGFVAALLNPPEPGPRLREAARRYLQYADSVDAG